MAVSTSSRDPPILSVILVSGYPPFKGLLLITAATLAHTRGKLGPTAGENGEAGSKLYVGKVPGERKSGV